MLTVEGLTVRFTGRGRAGRVTALEDVDLTVDAGETVGLVGGSGAGKSTVARAVAGLIRPDRGRITLDGLDLLAASRAEQRQRRRALHLVFQDPYAALPPTLPVAGIVAEPLLIQGLAGRQHRAELVREALAAVALQPVERFISRYPHQLSGGERQRVALARALITRPKLLLADEPTAMLDASVRGQLVDLLDDLRVTWSLAVLHITHDLALAQRSCDHLIVLQAGRVVEHGATERLLARPEHPYTAALVEAAHRLHGSTPAIR